ncbi:hypothetical protein [Streptomyces aureus]|uniref:Uncharacterized protein n=1 Tax=Streptomyces aureus TaxID=193461 RepID=A0ABV4SH77_9ACTN
MTTTAKSGDHLGTSATQPGRQIETARQGGGVSRRGLVAAAGAAGLGALLDVQPAAAASPVLWARPGGMGMPPVSGLHLQFGADAAHEVVVSWQTAVPVQRPRVMLGTPTHGLGGDTAAQTSYYKDAASGQTIYVHHAR